MILNFFVISFGILILSLIFGGAVWELCLRCYQAFVARFLSHEIRRQDFLDPAYHPYINWTDSWNKAMFRYIPIATRTFNLENPIAPVKNNSLGFRTYEWEEVDPQCVRIAILGGSAAWGFGASSNDTTIAGHLERFLNESNLLGTSRVQVFNLAQVNQTQTQDIVTALFLFPRIRPHIVVAVNGWNELAAGITFDADIMRQWKLFPISELLNWEPMEMGNNSFRVGRDSLFFWGAKRSHFIRQIAPWVTTPKPPRFKRSVAEQVKLASPLFLQHMEQMQVLAKGFGFRYYQVCQPNLYRKKNPVEWEISALELYDKYRPMMAGKENGDFLRSHDLYEEIVDVASRNPDRFGTIVNLGDIFRETSERRFHSLVHCTDAGYGEIARTISDIIILNGV